MTSSFKFAPLDNIAPLNGGWGRGLLIKKRIVPGEVKCFL